MVDGRAKRENLPSLSYGGCFSRILHYLSSLHLQHPKLEILLGKLDFKAAYRRVSLHRGMAEKCTIMFKEFTLSSVRLTFGGSPCPHEFCIFSEICADLANDLLHCLNWDPESLASPHSTNLKEPTVLDDSIPFATAKPLDIFILVDDQGEPNCGNNKSRALQAMLLALHTLCQPLDRNEPILRDDCLSLEKL